MHDSRKWRWCEQLQEMRNAATKQNAQTTKSKDDCTDLRTTFTNIRDKINDLETQVINIRLFTFSHPCHCNNVVNK